MTRFLSTGRLHKSYLKSVSAEGIAYLWPSVPLRIYEELHRRGVPIVSEAVNTCMADAKAVLDAAYDQLGLPPDHGISAARIANEQARHALSTAIVSPSPATDRSLCRASMADRLVPSSYGAWLPPHMPVRLQRSQDAPVTFLFVGISGIRKGLHHLLTAWRQAPANARLRIVGADEPALHRIFSDVFSMPNVSCTGFTADTVSEYRAADVFILPSLEEGDPIVTYEAASHGLPVLASAAGAGRMGAETNGIHSFDTSDIAGLSFAIAEFTRSEELRRHWAERARAAVINYDWNLVAPRRFARLAEFLKSRT